MKHIFLGAVNEKVYFLGWYRLTSYEGFRKHVLNWDNPNLDQEGHISFDSVFKEYETISTTEDLLRELDISESVWIENAEHVVDKKSYGLSGEVVYILKTKRLIENEESLAEVNKEIEKRKIFVKEQKEKVLDELALLHDPIDNRNWFLRLFFPISK